MNNVVTQRNTASESHTSTRSSSSCSNNSTGSQKSFILSVDECITPPGQTGHSFFIQSEAGSNIVKSEIDQLLDKLEQEKYLQEIDDKNTSNCPHFLDLDRKGVECHMEPLMLPPFQSKIMFPESENFVSTTAMPEKGSTCMLQEKSIKPSNIVCLPFKSPEKPSFSFLFVNSPTSNDILNTNAESIFTSPYLELSSKSTTRRSSSLPQSKSTSRLTAHSPQTYSSNSYALKESFGFNKSATHPSNLNNIDKVISLAVPNPAVNANNFRPNLGRVSTASDLDELLLQHKHQNPTRETAFNSDTDSYKNQRQQSYDHLRVSPNYQEHNGRTSRRSAFEKLTSAITAKMVLDTSTRPQSINRPRMSLSGANSPVIHSQEFGGSDIPYKKTTALPQVSYNPSNRPATMIPSMARRSSANLRGMAASDAARRRSWNFTPSPSSSQYSRLNGRSLNPSLSIESNMPHYQNPTVVSQLRDIRNQPVVESPALNGRRSPPERFRRRDSSGSLMLYNKNALFEPEESPVLETSEAPSHYSHIRTQSSLSNRDRVDAFLKEQQLAEYEDAETNFFSVDPSKYVRRIHSMEDDLHPGMNIKTLFAEIENVKKMLVELQERVTQQEIEVKMRPIRPIPMIVKKIAEEPIEETKAEENPAVQTVDAKKELTNQEIQDHITKLSERLEQMFQKSQMKEEEKIEEVIQQNEEQESSSSGEEPTIISEGLRKRVKNKETPDSDTNSTSSVTDTRAINGGAIEEINEIAQVASLSTSITDAAIVAPSFATTLEHQSFFEKTSVHFFIVAISFFVVILIAYLLATFYLFMVEYTERTITPF